MDDCQVFIRDNEKGEFLNWCDRNNIKRSSNESHTHPMREGDRYVFIESDEYNTRTYYDKEVSMKHIKNNPIIELNLSVLSPEEDNIYINQAEIEQFKKQLNNQL